MWLRRSLDKDLLKDLVKFMDETNADSVRIHAKLWYYDSYLLAPTEHFVKGQRMLKTVGSNILSHNATIWRKDYILKHQLPGEDPWLNEEAGSKRMLSDKLLTEQSIFKIGLFLFDNFSSSRPKVDAIESICASSESMICFKFRYSL